MPNMGLYIVLGVVLAVSVHNVLCCGPVELGQQYIIRSTANVPSGVRVEWQLDSSVVIYSSELPNPNPFPDVFVGSRTKVTILNVDTNTGTRSYQHIVQGKNVYSCNLLDYSSIRPSSPTCENMTLNGNQIRTKCTTSEVFPTAKCQFTLRNGGIIKENITDESPYIIYNHTDAHSGRPGYNSSSCTLEFPTNKLEAGNWTVQVKMYPDLPDVSSDKEAKGEAANSLTFSISTVRIDYNNCPKALDREGGDINIRDGYLRQGERVSCLCIRVDAGIPPGTLVWRSTQGGNFDILSQTENASTIQINSSAVKEDTFTCQSTPMLIGSQTMTYTAKYALVPSSVSISFQPPGPIYFCSIQRTNVDITCQVPNNSFNPAVLFTIRDDNSNILSVNDTVSQVFTKSGRYTFTCRVENTIFNDLASESPASAIEVYEPPSDPPKISARSSQHGHMLLEGDDVIVTCSVSGGYPPVQSVTLTCGQDPSLTSKGNSVKLPIPFIPMSYNATSCTCKATHVSGCYRLVNVSTLTILPVNTTITEEIKNVEQMFTPAQLAGGIIGTMVTFVVLVAAIALIVFYVRRGKQKRNKDTGYDMIERPPGQPYQNVRPRDPNYLTINPPDPSQGNESAHEKTENSQRNQVSTGNTEPTEPTDVNGYSDIKDVNGYSEMNEADVNGYSERNEADVNGYSEMKDADVNGYSEMKDADVNG